MSKKVSASYIIIIGLMLFALFFGAGNLIFPPMLGQMAGKNVWVANAGFLVTGVGLPLLAITAFVFSGKQNLQSLASRVHPVFGIVFTTILYLAIGPFFAIPRSGNVSFEIGVKPFLSNDASPVSLIIFTILFFALACLLSLNALVAFVFGIIIVNALKEQGASTKKQLMGVCAKAAAIAAVLLAVMYTALSYMGASSVEELGILENGAEVLAKISSYYFGSYGSILLGLMITVACLTTSVGLITACSSFFHELFPNISYKKIAVVLSVFSTLVANIGLTQLIKVSMPVLLTMYPIAISLIFLTFLHSVFKGKTEVYQGSLLFAFIISLFDGLKEAGIKIEVVNHIFTQILPMYNIGLGWLIPAITGGICGYILSIFRTKTS